MDDCVEAGAEDVDFNEGVAEIMTDPTDFRAVSDALSEKGYTFASAQVEQVPTTTTALTEEESQVKMRRLLDALEDDDDVQEIWHNLENEDEI